MLNSVHFGSLGQIWRADMDSMPDSMENGYAERPTGRINSGSLNSVPEFYGRRSESAECWLKTLGRLASPSVYHWDENTMLEVAMLKMRDEAAIYITNYQLPNDPVKAGRRWGQRHPQGANLGSNGILNFLSKLKQWLPPAHPKSLASQCMSGQPISTCHALTS